MKLRLVVCLFALLLVGPIAVSGEASMIYNQTIDSINGVRYENYLVYFSYNVSGKTGTNVYGYEIAVDQNNCVIEVGTNVTMVEGGYALSAHGTKAIALRDVEIGDIVEANLTEMTVVIQRDPIDSSYYRSLSNYQKAESLYSQSQMSMIAFDCEAVDTLYTQIQSDFERVSTLFQKGSLTSEEETELVTIAYQINKNTLNLTYMTAPTSLIEIRAMWHRPNATSIKETNLDGMIRFMDRVQSLGINTIYVETFWNGYASYRSEILETHPTLAAYSYGDEYGNDYIKAFIGEATKRGISVHAWVHTFNAGNPTYLSSRINSDWLLEDYQGRTLHPNTYGGAYYMDPSNPDVLDFVNAYLSEMVTNYDFDGVQLDYIRYYDNNYNSVPIRDSGYGDGPETRFKAAYGLTGDVRTLVLNQSNRDKWFEWRQHNVTNAVKSISETLRLINPNILISADVVGSISHARNTYMQDWLTWVQNGYIDLLCPMIYTSSVDYVQTLSETICNQLTNLSFLSSGIAPVYSGYSVYNQHLQMLAAAPYGGNAIFASQSIISDNEVEFQLKEGIYRNQAISPFASVPEIITFVTETMRPLVEENVTDPTIRSMFLQKFSELETLPNQNPADWEVLRNKASMLSQLGPYLSNRELSDLIHNEFSILEHTLDIKISREMIRLGYYDPQNDERPDPMIFEYPDTTPENPDDDNPVNPDDDNPDIPSDPIDDTPQNQPSTPSQLTTIIISVGSLVTVLTTLITFIVLKRRKL